MTALACPTLAVFSSLLGYRAGILWQCVLVSSLILVLGIVLSEKKIRCQSRTRDGDQCKRMVPQPQKVCSQHAHGWRAKLRAISRNPSASFYGTVYGTALSMAVSIAMSVGSPRYPQGRFDAFKGTPVTYAQLELMRETQRWPTETLRTQDSVKVNVTRKNLPKTAPAGGLEVVIK
jgi:hypothetical protein